MNKYLSVFSNRRMLVTLLLGFSGGLPLALVGSTLQAWLARSAIDIATIGQFALVGYPYALKFLWAPFMDNTPLPFLGLRRGWMAVSQIGLFAATFGLATVNPAHAMPIFSLLAFLVAFFSASQDIVIDAYRTEIIEEEAELGAGASTYITGYRIATLVSGGVALGLVDHIGWRNVYILMAVVNLVGLVTILCSKEPKVTRNAEQEKKKNSSFLVPFIEFFQRSGAMEILIFVMIYKLSTLMATALTTKFLVDLGYSNTMIGAVNKGAGLIATIGGTLAGGALMAKLGLKRSLWVFGVLQATVGITFCVLSGVAGGGTQNLWLVVVVSIDNFFMGMGTAALTGFLMHVCSRRYTATHYALLTSVLAVGRVVLIAHAGTLVAWMGYNMFFLATVPLAIPGLLLLRRYDHWEASSGKIATTKLPKFDLGLMLMMIAALLLLSSDPIWKWLDMRAVGTDVALAGAFGVLAVVAVGLLRPHLKKA
jgi:PAT family beta-lactamase induction signal transducer AmpG